MIKKKGIKEKSCKIHTSVVGMTPALAKAKASFWMPKRSTVGNANVSTALLNLLTKSAI